MSRAAGGQAIEAYWDELAGFLGRRLGDPAIAADLTQETYLRAEAVPANIAIIYPRAWLFATARNLLVDHARRRRVRGFGLGAADDLTELPDEQPRIDAVLLAREELDVLARAVDALPPRTREVFCLHRFDGKSYAEIAQELGIAKNTVMVHMMKALRLCRDALREHREAGDATNGPRLAERLPMA